MNKFKNVWCDYFKICTLGYLEKIIQIIILHYLNLFFSTNIFYIDELTISTRPDKLPAINEKNLPVINTDLNDPTITANDCINSEISNDECLSQSPLNLTRSQGLLNFFPLFCFVYICNSVL